MNKNEYALESSEINESFLESKAIHSSRNFSDSLRINNNLITCGYIARQKGTIFKRWAVEWISLQSNFLVTFVSKQSLTSTKCIAIPTIVACDPIESVSSPSIKFALLYNTQDGLSEKLSRIVFRCESQNERNQWVQSINTVVRNYKELMMIQKTTLSPSRKEHNRRFSCLLDCIPLVQVERKFDEKIKLEYHEWSNHVVTERVRSGFLLLRVFFDEHEKKKKHYAWKSMTQALAREKWKKENDHLKKCLSANVICLSLENVQRGSLKRAFFQWRECRMMGALEVWRKKTEKERAEEREEYVKETRNKADMYNQEICNLHQQASRKRVLMGAMNLVIIVRGKINGVKEQTFSYWKNEFTARKEKCGEIIERFAQMEKKMNRHSKKLALSKLSIHAEKYRTFNRLILSVLTNSNERGLLLAWKTWKGENALCRQLKKESNVSTTHISDHLIHQSKEDDSLSPIKGSMLNEIVSPWKAVSQQEESPSVLVGIEEQPSYSLVMRNGGEIGMRDGRDSPVRERKNMVATGRASFLLNTLNRLVKKREEVEMRKIFCALQLHAMCDINSTMASLLTESMGLLELRRRSGLHDVYLRGIMNLHCVLRQNNTMHCYFALQKLKQFNKGYGDCGVQRKYATAYTALNALTKLFERRQRESIQQWLCCVKEQELVADDVDKASSEPKLDETEDSPLDGESGAEKLSDVQESIEQERSELITE